MRSHEAIGNSMEYNDSAELLSDDEIIDSKVAQSILPYLTLDKLTIEEQTEILRLASDYIKLVDLLVKLHISYQKMRVILNAMQQTIA